MRRFPKPWKIQENDDAFWVEDASGKRFGFCYYRRDSVVGTAEARHLTREEALLLVRHFAKLGK